MPETNVFTADARFSKDLRLLLCRDTRQPDMKLLYLGGPETTSVKDHDEDILGSTCGPFAAAEHLGTACHKHSYLFDNAIKNWLLSICMIFLTRLIELAPLKHHKIFIVLYRSSFCIWSLSSLLWLFRRFNRLLTTDLAPLSPCSESFAFPQENILGPRCFFISQI